MKIISNLFLHHQQKIFYAFLAFLLFVGALLPAFASVKLQDPYDIFIQQALTKVEEGDLFAARQTFLKAQKLARKNKDKNRKQAFRDGLKKLEFYADYQVRTEEAEEALIVQSFKVAQSKLRQAREQIMRSIEIPAALPTLRYWEENTLSIVETKIAACEPLRKDTIQKALQTGDDLLLQNHPAEALEKYRYARSQTFDDSNENQQLRIGERILKAEFHQEAYVQTNLGRRAATYRQYGEARQAYFKALTAIERSKNYFFPELEGLDNQKYQEIQTWLEAIRGK